MSDPKEIAGNVVLHKERKFRWPKELCVYLGNEAFHVSNIETLPHHYRVLMKSSQSRLDYSKLE
jgi:hypothetical protein